MNEIKTKGQVLREAFPDHYAAIERNVKAGTERSKNPESWLDEPLHADFGPSELLSCAFLWSGTPEGHDFWKTLSASKL